MKTRFLSQAFLRINYLPSGVLISNFFPGKNVDFWRDMTVITQDELQTLKKLSEDGVSVKLHWV